VSALESPVGTAVLEQAAEAAYRAGMKFRGDNIIFEEWANLPDYWKQIYRAQTRAVLEVLL
jgi:hypothetical protein